MLLLRSITASLLLPLLSLTPSLSLAQETQQIAQTIDCKTPQTTLEINACAEREYKAADRQLNQVYRQLRSQLSGQQRQRITNAQLAWIKFRDANCDYERGQFEGGTMASSVETNCLARITEQRAKELEEYLQDTKR